MKISESAYKSLKEDICAIVKVMEETGLPKAGLPRLDVNRLDMRDMWDLVLAVNLERGNVDHPWLDQPNCVGRVLEYTGRSIHWLYDRDGENLDDSHIETALKAIRKEIVADRDAALRDPAVRSRSI